MELTKRQSTRIDRWLTANMDGTHTVSYAVDRTRTIAFPKLPDAPLRGDDFEELAEHVKRRCLALGLTIKRLDITQPLTATGNVVCSVCGIEFVPSNSSAKRCPACRRRNLKPHKQRASLSPMECHWCGRGFVPRVRNARYCGESCRLAAKAERSRIRYEKLSEGHEPQYSNREYGKRKCAECGQWFTRRSPNAAYCSEGCRKIVKARQRKEAHFYRRMKKD